MYGIVPPTVTPPRRRFGWLRRPIGVVMAVLVVVAIGGVAGVIYMGYWYDNALKPYSAADTRIRVTVSSGTDATQIGKLLQDKRVIKSARAFSHYVSKTGHKDDLQAGTYLFSPAYSVQRIVDMLIKGEVDNYNLTLVPGKRLDQIATSLQKAGYEKAAIDTALAKAYDHPLLADKPPGASLEGYIFPETYTLDSQTTADKLLVTTFDTFWQRIQKEGLADKLKSKGLSIYQAITLASIVQQEVSTYEDQQKVAQVFLRRLKEGIPLGADPTFRYASHKAGVADYINIDSPYNTRIYKGLPPGPIGNFNLSALKAVADPAPTNYLYFVAGDDGITRFSDTQETHEALTAKYCIKLCQQ